MRRQSSGSGRDWAVAGSKLTITVSHIDFNSPVVLSLITCRSLKLFS